MIHFLLRLARDFIVAGGTTIMNNAEVRFIELLISVMTMIALLGVISITIDKAFKRANGVS